MTGNFQVIVADPPWGNFKDTLRMSDVARGAKANYPTMSIAEIEKLPIKEHINPNGAILCLWVPSSLLQDGLDVMKAWGFAHKQTYVWVKTKKDPLQAFLPIFRHFKKLKAWSWTIIGTSVKKCLDDFSLSNVLAFGMGRLFRQTHEICLIGTSNTRIYRALSNKSQRSVSFAQNLRHSAKPEHLQDSLDLMFPNGDKLELFARRQRPRWTCLGNEVCQGEDIRVSLSKL
jgi:N6-adenosine-specific RNA methylase IME4